MNATEIILARAELDLRDKLNLSPVVAERAARIVARALYDAGWITPPNQSTDKPEATTDAKDGGENEILQRFRAIWTTGSIALHGQLNPPAPGEAAATVQHPADSTLVEYIAGQCQERCSAELSSADAKECALASLYCIQQMGLVLAAAAAAQATGGGLSGEANALILEALNDRAEDLAGSKLYRFDHDAHTVERVDTVPMIAAIDRARAELAALPVRGDGRGT